MKNDLTELADRAPNKSASDPTVNDDSGDGYFAGSLWFNTSTQVMWVCTDASAGAAVWRSLYKRESGALILCPSDGSGQRALQLDESGNTRGNNAVDLQSTRTIATQVASGSESFIAGGRSNTASGAQAHAEGYNTTSSGIAAHAEGSSTTAGGIAAHAEGYQTQATQTGAHSEGASGGSNKIRAISRGAHAEGYTNGATAQIYAGNSTEAIGRGAHAEGYAKGTGIIQAKGPGAHAEGYATTGDVNVAFGEGAHAEGRNCSASQASAHAEGQDTTASGPASHAEGRETTASGTASHAEGREATASGYNSHAEGLMTDAPGYASHAECYSTTASGTASHAEGGHSTASGMYSHAEGNLASASGTYSHAGGKESKAHLRAQWARAAGGHSGQLGTAQSTHAVLFRRTTDATQTELTLSGSTPTASSRFTILDGQTLSCLINIVGRKENGGSNDHASFLRQVCIRREGSTTALVGSVQTVGTDINPAGWGGVTITADNTNESLKIEVTGAASTNIRWTAAVLASEAADAAI